MGTYVTDTGFARPTLQELKLRFEERFRALYGDKIDTDASGPTGQLVGLLSDCFDDAWSCGQEVYSSHAPSLASGLALDVVCDLTGVTRIAAAASQVLVACYAAESNLPLTIASGRQVKRTRGGLVFSLRAGLVVQTSTCRDIYLTLANDPTPGDTVTLVASFGTFSVAAPSTSDVKLGTYQLLAAAINAGTWEGQASYWATGSAPAGAQFTDACLRLVLPEANFGVVDTATWNVELCGSVGWFDCDSVGPNSATTGEIVEIVTNETGWEACYNLTEAVLGRLAETDEELRIRRAQSFRTGYATENAIRQGLLNRVDGIVSALVVSNRTMATDSDGRPPKSFEAIVQGGLDQQIGDTIWLMMPAGIECYADLTPGEGGIAVNVVDSQGTTQVVKFSRPVSKYLHAKIQFSLYDEEAFPSDGESQLRTAVLDWALQEFQLGKDVIPTRFFSPVYSVPGISTVTVLVGLTGGEDDVPAYGTGIIEVGGRVIVSLLDKNLSLQEV